MSMIRPIELSDIPKTFRVRTATDENRLTLAELAALGINENSVKEKLLSSYKGWLILFSLGFERRANLS